MAPPTDQGFLREVFDTGAGVRGWLVLLFIAINGLVLWNAIFHDPRIGYDARQHLEYARVLASLRLPVRAETAAFYAPPLAYLVPALALKLGGLPLVAAAKVGQIAQLVLSVVLTLALLRVCQRLRPGDGVLKLTALGLCGMPAVYYRTFSMVRGEPYLACLGIVAIALTLASVAAARFDLRRAVLLGLVCGAIGLARQLGLLLLLGLGAFALVFALRRPRLAGAVSATAVLAGGIALLLVGWFYLDLRSREGTAVAWNLRRRPFSFANQPLEFYVGTGDGELFRAPGRPRFQKQLGPVLLSDWWGDYWHYFLFRGRSASGKCVFWPATAAAIADPHRVEPGYSGNYAAMLAYLARVNLLALLPSLVLVSGLVVGAADLARFVRARDLDQRTYGVALVFLLAASTLAGFAWYVISFPRRDDGDTVKATYVFQVAPLLAVLGGEALVRLRSRSRAAFRAACALLVAVALHNAGAAVTRWRTPLDCWLPWAESGPTPAPGQRDMGPP